MPEGSDGQRLRIVLERVRRWLFTFIGDSQRPRVLYQNEIGIGALMLDRARLDITGDAQVARVGLVAHPLQLLNGDIVALVGLHSADGEINDRAENDENGNADARALVGAFHNCIYSTAICP